MIPSNIFRSITREAGSIASIPTRAASVGIGRVTLAWKYRIPTIATFLFEQSEYYERRRADPMAPDYDHMGTTGYRARATAVRERLEAYGFTLPFWAAFATNSSTRSTSSRWNRSRWR